MPELKVQPPPRPSARLQVIAGTRQTRYVPTLPLAEEIQARFEDGQEPSSIARGLRIPVQEVNDALRIAYEIERQKRVNSAISDRRFRRQDHEIEAEVLNEFRRRAA